MVKRFIKRNTRRGQDASNGFKSVVRNRHQPLHKLTRGVNRVNKGLLNTTKFISSVPDNIRKFSTNAEREITDTAAAVAALGATTYGISKSLIAATKTVAQEALIGTENLGIWAAGAAQAAEAEAVNLMAGGALAETVEFAAYAGAALFAPEFDIVLGFEAAEAEYAIWSAPGFEY